MKKIALWVSFAAVAMFAVLPVASANTWSWHSDFICNSPFWSGHAETFPEFCK